jgi:UDP-N-acetylglucosamine 1-carboxyvinyltransferase
VVSGPTPLQPTRLAIPDLRAGFAYVLAALLADGTSELSNVHYLQRGYEDIPAKLQSLGTPIEISQGVPG